MKKYPPYRPGSRDEIDRLVAEYPLAQVVSSNGDHFVATLLPLLLERPTRDEALLLGHFDRTNPQVEALRRQSRALALFTGVQGYVSPTWRQTPRMAPTWNYATVRFEVEVAFDEDQDATREALERLVEHMEGVRRQPWSIADMGERYAAQARGVIAFRARVLATDAKFKLGQNERSDNFAGIVDELWKTDQEELAMAMTRACPGVDPGDRQ
ncbi:MAG: FMN-binding negative transcriptional regulator [Gammaproteobacteria bacterium]|nr:FMN-binding negative transcriptional regulator [Gammaproteobacteria bacterium]